MNVFPEGSMAEWRINSLLVAEDGSLWIGGSSRIGHLKGGRLKILSFAGRAVQMIQDEGGRIFFAKTRGNEGDGAVCEVKDDSIDCNSTSEIPTRHASVLRRASNGELWVGSSGKLCRWIAGSVAQCFLEAKLKALDGLDGITSVLVSREGTTWVGIGKSGSGFGLGQLQDGQWKSFSVPGLNGEALHVSALLEDRLGALWIGTVDQGIYRIWNGRFEHFGANSGLSGNTVSAEGLLQDREGTIWVATSSGLDAFRELAVTVYSTREGLETDGVESVLATSAGTVLISNVSLETIIDGTVASATLPPSLRGKAATSLLQRADGSIWIGLEDSVYTIEHGKFRQILDPAGASFGAPEHLFEDSAGDVWLRMVGKQQIFRARGLELVEEVSAQVGDPTAMTPDPAGGFWAAYDDGSIARFNRGNLTRIPAERKELAARPSGILPLSDGVVLVTTLRGLDWRRGSTQLRLDTKHGMPCNALYGIIEDTKGAIWINAICGLLRIDADELRRWAMNPSTSVAYRMLTTVDGFQPGRGAFSPFFNRGPDGRLWLANGKVAQVVDPARLANSTDAPAVLIENVTADRMTYEPADALTLSTNPKDISVRFTAPTFVVPQRVRFQYRLDGRDAEWRDGGTERQAFYTDLPPGPYRFRVKASTSQGVWSDQEASAAFEIPPAYYQTRWFRLLIVIAALAMLYGLYVLRMRQVAIRVSDRILAKNKERERIARDLHDTLLQGTQGLAYSVLAAANRASPDDPIKAMLEHAVERADEVIREGRDAIQGLRISNDIDRDLYEALSRVGTQLSDSYGTSFEATQDGQLIPLHPEVREELYFLGREALLNAFKHAHATAIELHLTFTENQFRLQVRDDGVGLALAGRATPVRPGHWGLQGMRERSERIGAVMDVWSRPNAGTEVDIRVDAASAYLAKVSRWRILWPRRAIDLH